MKKYAAYGSEQPDWELYRKGSDFLRVGGYTRKVRDAWKFYGDRQWEGFATDEVFGSDGPPFVNFIKQSVVYKLVTVAGNSVKIVFTPSSELNGAFAETAQAVCTALTANCETLWENMKLDSLRWRAVRDAAVSGDGAIYVCRENGRMKAQLVDFSSVLLADENDPDIQAQDYIIVSCRRTVASLRREARAAGLAERVIETILPDSETDTLPSDEGESELTGAPEDGKALVLLKFWRQDGRVYMSRCTRTVPLLGPTDTGLTLYPIAKMAWEEIKGSARGHGVVTPQIPNQVEFNKTLARRALKVIETAYPKLVYNETRVDNPEELDSVGARIAVTGDDLPVRSIVDYLTPAAASPDVAALSADLLRLTQNAYGASDAALGNVDPENASGKAILAVQDANARVLSLQSQQYSQFVEDLALILFDYWRAETGADGRTVVYTDEESGARVEMKIPRSVMEALAVKLKIEVSPAGSFSQLAQEQTLENYMNAGKISFEELVESLPDNGITPKSTLQRIIRKRNLK